MEYDEVYDFLIYWRDKVKKGESSELTRLEILAIKCFYLWQRERKEGNDGSNEKQSLS